MINTNTCKRPKVEKCVQTTPFGFGFLVIGCERSARFANQSTSVLNQTKANHFQHYIENRSNRT